MTLSVNVVEFVGYVGNESVDVAGAYGEYDNRCHFMSAFGNLGDKGLFGKQMFVGQRYFAQEHFGVYAGNGQFACRIDGQKNDFVQGRENSRKLVGKVACARVEVRLEDTQEMPWRLTQQSLADDGRNRRYRLFAGFAHGY